MNLQATQQWLWSVLQQSSDAVTDAKSRLCDGGLPALERLAIYARGYRLRLLECLRAEFPVLHSMLGARLFDSFALEYLATSPPSSYTLNDLGAGFPRYLAAQRPDAGGAAQHEDWVDFMIDLARLEWTTSAVYNGMGDEEAAPTERPTVARSLCLLQFTHPVHACLQAFRQNQEPGLPQPSPTWLAVARRNYRVLIEPLNRVEFELLQRLQAGQTDAVLADIRAGAGGAGVALWLQRQVARGLLLPMQSLQEQL